MITVPEFLIHLPYFFDPSTTQAQIGPLWFLVFTGAEAILFAAIFNNTRGSLLIVTGLHASQNAWSNIFSGADQTHFKVVIVMLLVTAFIVTMVLARGAEPPIDELAGGAAV